MHRQIVGLKSRDPYFLVFKKVLGIFFLVRRRFTSQIRIWAYFWKSLPFYWIICRINRWEFWFALKKKVVGIDLSYNLSLCMKFEKCHLQDLFYKNDEKMNFFFTFFQHFSILMAKLSEIPSNYQEKKCNQLNYKQLSSALQLHTIATFCYFDLLKVKKLHQNP